jgi:ribosome biogenesis GTPase A
VQSDFNSLPLSGWYPGHMAEATRKIGESLRLVDLVVEVCDARIPGSSRNPAFDRLFENRPRCTVFNKADLADPDATARWKVWHERRGIRFVPLSACSGQGLRPLVDEWQATFEGIRRERGVNRPLQRSLRVLIAGVPNVGKSTLINRLAGERKVAVGPLPGVTRSTHWIPIQGAVELLDTPGVLWPKIRDKQHELRLALCGCIKDEVVGAQLLGEFLWYELARLGAPACWKLYDLPGCPESGSAFLHAVARRRGMLRSGGATDDERSASTVLREFRDGKLGRFTFELPAPPS